MQQADPNISNSKLTLSRLSSIIFVFKGTNKQFFDVSIFDVLRTDHIKKFTKVL